MAHEDRQTYLMNDDRNADYNLGNNQQDKSMQQQLSDANKEIEDLKLQLAWLDRPYE